MNNLTPQIRPDVNGKLVTRHVRMEAPESRLLSVPAPTMRIEKYSDQYDDDLMAITDHIDNTLVPGVYRDSGISDRDVLQRNLDRMEPSILAAFRQQIDNEPHVGYTELLMSVLHNNLDAKDASYTLFIVQQQQEQNPGRRMDNYWDDGLEGTVEYDNASRYWKGVKQFAAKSGYSLPANILEASDKSRREVGGLVKMLTAGYALDLSGIVEMEWGTEAIRFTGTALGKLAMEYPDDVQRIIEIIKDRGIEEDKDMEPIRAVLNAEVQSLSSGVL